MAVPTIKKATDIEKAEKPTKYHFEILLDAEIGKAYFIPKANVPYVRKAKESWCSTRDINLRVTTASEDGVNGAKIERIA